nr:unnamed protein product [Callosobruchus chinensis]
MVPRRSIAIACIGIANEVFTSIASSFPPGPLISSTGSGTETAAALGGLTDYTRTLAGLWGFIRQHDHFTSEREDLTGL